MDEHELDEYDRVLLRLTNTDKSRLEPILYKLLPVVLTEFLNLEGDNLESRKQKLISILTHILYDYRAETTYPINLHGLIKLWTLPELKESWKKSPFNKACRYWISVFFLKGVERINLNSDDNSVIELITYIFNSFYDSYQNGFHPLACYLISYCMAPNLLKKSEFVEKIGEVLYGMHQKVELGLATLYNNNTLQDIEESILQAASNLSSISQAFLEMFLLPSNLHGINEFDASHVPGLTQEIVMLWASQLYSEKFKHPIWTATREQAVQVFSATFVMRSPTSTTTSRPQFLEVVPPFVAYLPLLAASQNPYDLIRLPADNRIKSLNATLDVCHPWILSRIIHLIGFEPLNIMEENPLFQQKNHLPVSVFNFIETILNPPLSYHIKSFTVHSPSIKFFNIIIKLLLTSPIVSQTIPYNSPLITKCLTYQISFWTIKASLMYLYEKMNKGLIETTTTSTGTSIISSIHSVVQLLLTIAQNASTKRYDTLEKSEDRLAVFDLTEDICSVLSSLIPSCIGKNTYTILHPECLLLTYQLLHSVLILCPKFNTIFNCMTSSSIRLFFVLNSLECQNTNICDTKTLSVDIMRCLSIISRCLSLIWKTGNKDSLTTTVSSNALIITEEEKKKNNEYFNRIERFFYALMMFKWDTKSIKCELLRWSVLLFPPWSCNSRLLAINLKSDKDAAVSQLALHLSSMPSSKKNLLNLIDTVECISKCIKFLNKHLIWDISVSNTFCSTLKDSLYHCNSLLLQKSECITTTTTHQNNNMIAKVIEFQGLMISRIQSVSDTIRFLLSFTINNKTDKHAILGRNFLLFLLSEWIITSSNTIKLPQINVVDIYSMAIHDIINTLHYCDKIFQHQFVCLFELRLNLLIQLAWKDNNNISSISFQTQCLMGKSLGLLLYYSNILNQNSSLSNENKETSSSSLIQNSNHQIVSYSSLMIDIQNMLEEKEKHLNIYANFMEGVSILLNILLQQKLENTNQLSETFITWIDNMSHILFNHGLKILHSKNIVQLNSSNLIQFLSQALRLESNIYLNLIRKTENDDIHEFILSIQYYIEEYHHFSNTTSSLTNIHQLQTVTITNKVLTELWSLLGTTAAMYGEKYTLQLSNWLFQCPKIQHLDQEAAVLSGRCFCTLGSLIENYDTALTLLIKCLNLALSQSSNFESLQNAKNVIINDSNTTVMIKQVSDDDDNYNPIKAEYYCIWLSMLVTNKQQQQMEETNFQERRGGYSQTLKKIIRSKLFLQRLQLVFLSHLETSSVLVSSCCWRGLIAIWCIACELQANNEEDFDKKDFLKIFAGRTLMVTTELIKRSTKKKNYSSRSEMKNESLRTFLLADAAILDMQKTLLKRFVEIAQCLNHPPLLYGLTDLYLPPLTNDFLESILNIGMPVIPMDNNDENLSQITTYPRIVCLHLAIFLGEADAQVKDTIKRVLKANLGFESIHELLETQGKDWTNEGLEQLKIIFKTTMEGVQSFTPNYRYAAIHALTAILSHDLPWVIYQDELEPLWKLCTTALDCVIPPSNIREDGTLINENLSQDEQQDYLKITRLATTLRKFTVRCCNPQNSSSDNAAECLLLTVRTIKDLCEERIKNRYIAYLCMDTLVQCVDIAGVLVRPYFGIIVPFLIISLAALEPAEFNFYQFHVERETGISEDQFMEARVSMSSGTPAGQLLEKLAKLATASAVEELSYELCVILTSGPGIPTRVGVIRFIDAIISWCGLSVISLPTGRKLFKTYCVCLRSSPSILRRYIAHSLGRLARAIDPDTITKIFHEEILEHLLSINQKQQWTASNWNDLQTFRSAAGDAILQLLLSRSEALITNSANSTVNVYRQIAALAFTLRYMEDDENPSVPLSWKNVWNEIEEGQSTIERFQEDIIKESGLMLMSQFRKDRKTGASTILQLIQLRHTYITETTFSLILKYLYESLISFPITDDVGTVLIQAIMISLANSKSVSIETEEDIILNILESKKLTEYIGLRCNVLRIMKTEYFSNKRVTERIVQSIRIQEILYSMFNEILFQKTEVDLTEPSVTNLESECWIIWGMMTAISLEHHHALTNNNNVRNDYFDTFVGKWISNVTNVKSSSSSLLINMLSAMASIMHVVVNHDATTTLDNQKNTTNLIINNLNIWTTVFDACLKTIELQVIPNDCYKRETRVQIGLAALRILEAFFDYLLKLKQSENKNGINGSELLQDNTHYSSSSFELIFTEFAHRQNQTGQTLLHRMMHVIKTIQGIEVFKRLIPYLTSLINKLDDLYIEQ